MTPNAKKPTHARPAPSPNLLVKEEAIQSVLSAVVLGFFGRDGDGEAEEDDDDDDDGEEEEEEEEEEGDDGESVDFSAFVES